MRTSDAKTYKKDTLANCVARPYRNMQGLGWTGFVTLAVLSAGCSQTTAADAVVLSSNRNVIATNDAQENPLAKQLSQMAEITREQARADEAISLQTVTMSQERIDALLLKNSIMHMVSTLDRYRTFFRSLHR